MQVNSITASLNNTNYSGPAFGANILNYDQIYNNLKTTPLLRVGDDRSFRLNKLEGMKKLINKAGDKLTNILAVTTGQEGSLYSPNSKTLYRIDVTNDRFPNLKYSENLDMYSGTLDSSRINEQILDKLTDEYVIKSAPRAEAFTKKSIKELETKLLAKISLISGKLPSEVLEMFGIKSSYWKEIAEDALKTTLPLSPEELVAGQKEFQNSYAEFLNLKDIRA